MTELYNILKSLGLINVDLGLEGNDLNQIINDLFNDATQKETQNLLVKKVFSNSNFLTLLEGISSDNKDSMLFHALSYLPEISSLYINNMLNSHLDSDIWAVYFNSINIPFSIKKTKFFEDLKDPDNEKALEYLAIYLVQNTIDDLDLLKKAISISLKQDRTKVFQILKQKPELKSLIISIMLLEFEYILMHDGIQLLELLKELKPNDQVELFNTNWKTDKTVSMLILDFCCNELVDTEIKKKILDGFLYIIKNFDLEDKKSIFSHKSRLGNILFFSLSLGNTEIIRELSDIILNQLDIHSQKAIFREILQPQNSIYKEKLTAALPLDNFLLLCCHHPAFIDIKSKFSNCVTKDFLRGPQINWNKILSNFPNEFNIFNSNMMKLSPNVLIKAANLNDDIFNTVLDKIQELQTKDGEAAHKILQEFIDSEPKIKIKDEKIFKLIKLLLNDPKQTTILHTIQRLFGNNINLDINLEPYTEEELKKLLSQTYIKHDGFNYFMWLIYNQSDRALEILNKINIFDAQILSQENPRGRNVLNLAAQYHPKAISKLLSAIKKLDKNEQFKILSHSDSFSHNNALNAAQWYHPTEVSQLLSAIKELDKNQQFRILSHIGDYGYSALMLAARNQPTLVSQLLSAIKELDKNQQFEILSQYKYKENGDENFLNALKFAAVYRTEAVNPILKMIGELNLPHQIEIYRTVEEEKFLHSNPLFKNLITNVYTYALENRLFSLKQVIPFQDKSLYLLQDIYQIHRFMQNHKMIFGPLLMKQLNELIDNFKHKDYSKMRQSIQIIARENKNIQLSTWYTTLVKKELSKLLKRVLERDIPYHQINNILWPNKEPYNSIEDKENILKIIEKLSPQWIIQIKKDDTEFNEFKQIFKSFPEDWQDKWLHFCHKALAPTFYQEIYTALTTIDIHSALSIKTTNVVPTAPSFETLEADKLSKIQHIPWPNKEPYSNISDKNDIESIIAFLSSSWLMKNMEEFKPIFQAFPDDWQVRYLKNFESKLSVEDYQTISEQLYYLKSDPIFVSAYDVPTSENLKEAQAYPVDSQSLDNIPIAVPYFLEDSLESSKLTEENSKKSQPVEFELPFITYMHQSDLLGKDARKLEEKRKIEENKSWTIQFYLGELAYFAHRYLKLAEKIQDSASPKKTALINLSKDLLCLQEGLKLIHEQIQETPSDASYEEKLKIYTNNLKVYQLHLDFLDNYISRFENFKKQYTGILNFTSALQLPNGQYAHVLVELAPRKPVAPIQQKTMIETDEQLHSNLLIHDVQKKDFIDRVEENKQNTRFFKAKDSKNKNLLLLALETRDLDKINAVANTIYNFNESERNEILEACNQKGYRLTSYIRNNSKNLCILELERLALKIKSLNSKDPNSQILKDLASHLRTTPEDYLEDINNAKKALRKNSSWRQWLLGSYSSTDYGIGILKESMESLLDKIQTNMQNSTAPKKLR